MAKRKVRIKEVVMLDADYAKSLVLETLDGKLVIPIVVSQADVLGLSCLLAGVVPDRPLTHQLLFDMFSRLEIEVKEVVIYKVEKGIFYTTLVCLFQDFDYEFEARPSDSLLLAKLFEAPIFIDTAVLEKVAIDVAEIPDTFLGDAQNEEEDDDIPLNFAYSEELFSDSNLLSLSKNDPDRLATFTIEALEQKLQEVVQEEDFEFASKLRDAIATKKQTGEPLS